MINLTTKSVFLRSICISALAASPAIASPAAAATREFSIPAQPMETAIPAFAKQAGRQIIANSNVVRGVRANPLRGKMTFEAALDRLLAGTGLVAVRASQSGGIIVIARAQPVAAGNDGAAPEQAETPAPAHDVIEAGDDIVVTARRRSETSLATPVVLTGVSAKEIERRNLTRMDQLTQVVPQLQIGSGTIQGGSIVMRGIGGNSGTTTADQGVTFNIDGAQIARSSVRRLGQIDMAQIEVLKGPQTLFFGKNSPGGVISIRSADPTSDFEGKASLQYEFEGREARFDGFASGPLTDTLGVRIALQASNLDGWTKNILPADLPYASPRRRLPHDQEISGRFTLKFDPSPTFSARFKFNYGFLDAEGPAENRQYIFCPLGIPSAAIGVNGSGENCKADDKISYTGAGPTFSQVSPRFGDGSTNLEQGQLLSSLELNANLSDGLTLTSLSSIYDVDLDYANPYVPTTNPALIYTSDYQINIRELNQELRLASSFDGPINFIVGGYLQDSRFLYDYIEARNASAPVAFSDAQLKLDGSHHSIFGQMRVNPIEQIELSAGGRYSTERKEISYGRTLGVVPPANPVGKWTDFSPELTATWRPTRTFTAFASYREGFLSGGFAPSGARYEQQLTKGAEAGIKALLFDGRLRTNLSIYRYVTTGLQVSYLEGSVLAITNAGKSTVKGIEADFSLQTGIEGLSLRGAIGVNNARYNIYQARCYTGQTISAGCNTGLLPNGAFSLQNLAGRQLNNAPDVTGNVGAAYEVEVGGGWKLSVSGDAAYTSSYYTDAQLPPSSKLDSYWLLDANLRVTSADGLWEVGLLGRNLTNKHYFALSNSVPFSGTTAGLPTGVVADRYAFLDRGRQISIQLTRRFGAQ